ncbi:HEPN domain-containing protein (plasmid) [Skermanella mucosa]|uniref:HEPN domain-containing protein n=1 Tax=Skermanella mucosa TaxID=1789672 RepID=UPI00192AB508|nr:HEPN domain-containing protein [Skermanella mucosa]UEM24772.1 HEPN domain-containing protein [Skermanella mucosa]
MAEDYESSALRHFRDAEVLAGKECYDNAGYLIGFAAECAVKSALLSFNLADKPHHKHFPEIRDIALKMFASRRDSAMHVTLRSAFLEGWQIHQRYEVTNSIDNGKYQSWKRDAQRILHAARLRSE